MAYQSIGRGTSANDGTGDDLRTGAGKVNANFVELYTLLGDGSTLSADPVVTEAATQTLTNKSLTSPTITGTGAIAGTFTGNITGDVTGNVTGDLTGDVTGNVTGDLTGNVTGNITGNITGDVTGNVTGDLTGDVTGNVTGNVDGIVGGTTPAAGSFTTVSLSDALQLAVFADGTARDATISAPAAGMLCFVSDNGSAVAKAQVYDGSVWVDLH